MLFNNKSRQAIGWEAGDAWLPKIFVRAGESFEVEIEFNWDREGITKDWSVTAWGEEGNVTVVHNEGLRSDNMPHASKDSYSPMTFEPAHIKEDVAAYVRGSMNMPTFNLPTMEVQAPAEPEYDGREDFLYSVAASTPAPAPMPVAVPATAAPVEIEFFDLDAIDGSAPINIEME